MKVRVNARSALVCNTVPSSTRPFSQNVAGHLAGHVQKLKRFQVAFLTDIFLVAEPHAAVERCACHSVSAKKEEKREHAIPNGREGKTEGKSWRGAHPGYVS